MDRLLSQRAGLGERPEVAGSHDPGLSLVELAIAMALFAVLVALFVPTYLSINRGESTTTAVTATDSAVRPVLIDLSKQVTSASVLYDPVNDSGSWANTGVNPGFALLVYTGDASAGECSQWRLEPSPGNPIDPNNANESLLQQRSWDPTSPPAALSFSTVGTGVVTDNTSSQPPFQLEGPSAPLDMALQLDLWFTSGPQSPNLEVSTVFAAQGTPPVSSDPCSSPPPTSPPPAS